MRAYFLHIIFTFIALFSAAQKPLVILEVEPKEAEIGEMLTISVKSNVQGEIEINFPSGFVHGYNIVNGMDQEIDYNSGKVISYYYLTQTGAMPKAGNFKIGPAYVKKGNKVYRSNTVNVLIKKESSSAGNNEALTAKQLRQPAFGVIEKSKSVLYEGESVLLNAKVYSQFSASHLEDYQAYSLDAALDKHEIGNTTHIVVEEEKIKRNTYYTFIYDKKVVFPIGTGKMTIDPFKLILRQGLDGMPIISSSATLEVKPLPGNVPKSFIGAVGQFSITRKVENGKFNQGDVFSLILEISGFGNLQNIIEPKLNLPKGFAIYGDPIVKEDFVYGSRGAEGKISYEYNIQLTQSGNLTLPETTIAYFDPTKEKYIEITTERDNFSVEKNDKFKAIPDDSASYIQTEITNNTFPFRRNSSKGDNDTLIYASKGFWVGVASPLFLAFLFGLFWKKSKEQSEFREQKLVEKKSHLEIKHLFTEAENALNEEDFSNYYGFIEKGIQRSMALFLRNDDTIILSKAEILQSLEERGISPSTINALQSLFSTCEKARYGLGLSAEERDNLVVSAKQIIETISRS
jgi:hypothetical protein